MRTLLVLFSVLLSGIASAQSATEALSPITVVITEYHKASAKLDEDCELDWHDHKSRGLWEGTRVIVLGEHKCKSEVASLSKLYYVIAIGSDELFINLTDISVPPAELERLRRLQDGDRDKYVTSAKIVAAATRREELARLEKIIESSRKAGITVVQASVAEASEYTEGMNFTVRVFNPTEKVVKYVWFTVIGYNAVNDPVEDGRNGEPGITVRGIGPIAKDVVKFYQWKYMWHTNIVRSIRISEIKVQYMDNTTRTIRDIKSVTLSRGLANLLEELVPTQ